MAPVGLPRPMLSHAMLCKHSARLCSGWDHLQHCACMSQSTRLATGCFAWYVCKSFTVKALAATAPGLRWSDIMVMLCEVMLWLCFGYIMTMLWLLLQLHASARREAVLWLPHEPGENEHVCSSQGPLSLLPASELVPCLLWVQWTV